MTSKLNFDFKKASLPGIKVMLMGASGTGKTFSIGTACDAGLKVIYFAYEQGAESLLGYYADRNLPIPSNLHICTVRPHSASFGEMADSIKVVNTLSFDAAIKYSDTQRGKYTQLESFLRSFNAIKSDAGVELGSLIELAPDTLVVLDGLTGLCDAAMKVAVGGKFVRDQKDWGISQSIVENVIRKITTDCRCHFALLAHVERETDQIVGGVKLMASALGKALAPKLPAMFSDVILTTRLGKEFFWDTENPTADLKTRNLPIAAKNAPSFEPLLKKWAARAGLQPLA